MTAFRPTQGRCRTCETLSRPRGLRLSSDEKELLAHYEVGFIWDARDRVLAESHLSPLSIYPLCDVCGEASGLSPCQIYGRWWNHAACAVQAKYEGLETAAMPPFAQWLYSMPDGLIDAIRAWRKTKDARDVMAWLEDWQAAQVVRVSIG